MLEYEEIERADDFTSGKKVKLEKPVKLHDGTYQEVVIAQGSGLGARTVGIFIEGEMIVEGQNEFGVLANLVDLSQNLEIEIKEV